jgi:DNA topoisomerase-2
MGKKKIEDQYKKLTDIEHVILRPGMYIGSIKPHTTTKWIVDEGKMISKK